MAMTETVLCHTFCRKPPLRFLGTSSYSAFVCSSESPVKRTQDSRLIFKDKKSKEFGSYTLKTVHRVALNSPSTTGTAATDRDGSSATEVDEDLRKFLQAILWIAECVYIIWLFLLPYAPIGGPACKKERKGQWPVLRHEHLDRMELSGFSGTRNELEFAKFIATSAQVLQTLVLRLSCRGYDLHGEDVYFEDEKDSKRIDTGVARAYLKDDFLSKHAALEFVL